MILAKLLRYRPRSSFRWATDAYESGESFKRKAATIVGKGLDAAGKSMKVTGDEEETQAEVRREEGANMGLRERGRVRKGQGSSYKSWAGGVGNDLKR